MRHLVALAVLVPATFAAFACSSSAPSEEVSAANLTDEELAKKALMILGAKGVAAPNEGNCQACHDVKSRSLLRSWKTQLADGMRGITDTSTPVQSRINALRTNPQDPTSRFASHRVGLLTAAAQFRIGNSVTKEKTPLTYEQITAVQELFRDAPEAYAEFQSDLLMPVEAAYPRLSARDYETVLTWMTKDFPQLNTYISVANAPTACVDSYNALRERASAIKSTSWAAVNRDNRMPMFACDSTSAAPETCFQQVVAGKPLFPTAEATEYGKGWALEGSNIRILRALDYNTFYWMRSSADGRFVANGGSARKSKIADLAAALKGTTRDIAVEANYDPDFFPDDKGFIYQGTKKGGLMCAQSLLTNPETTTVTFDENACSPLTEAVGLYQTIGQQVADNQIGDRFIVNSKNAADNHSQGEGKDQNLNAGGEAALKFTVAVPKGNQVEDGFAITQSQFVDSPFFGDTMMGRTGGMIGSRFNNADGLALGYVMHEVKANRVGAKYNFTIEELGRTCMPGNKANFSFDERFLTTHSYRTAENSTPAEWEAYKGKGSADIYVADFVTGKRVRITNMKPNQFALFPHFRSDGWLYILVRDSSTAGQTKEYIVASDYALQQAKAVPTP
jgi:hypothetical protein